MWQCKCPVFVQPVYILLRQTECLHSYLEVHLTIHTCICITLPDFCMMQVSCSCLLKRETLLHSCAPHKHLHKSEGKESKNFRSDPSEHWFYMHSTAVCSIGQLGWAGSSCSIKDYDSLYGVEVKVCLEVQKQPKLVIHPYTQTQNRCTKTEWKHLSQISSHQKWCHSHLLSSLTDVEAN